MSDFRIDAMGNCKLPDDLSRASDANVEDVVRRAAAFLGFETVTVTRVASVLGGSCIASTDVVAYASGVPMVVATPRLY